MFSIIGKGTVTRDKLIDWLRELGETEPSSLIREIEKKGRAIVNGNRILVVR